MKAPEQRQWHPSGVFIVNFEHISHLVLVFLLLTLNRKMPAGINPKMIPLRTCFAWQRNFDVISQFLNAKLQYYKVKLLSN